LRAFERGGDFCIITGLSSGKLYFEFQERVKSVVDEIEEEALACGGVGKCPCLSVLASHIPPSFSSSASSSPSSSSSSSSPYTHTGLTLRFSLRKDDDCWAVQIAQMLVFPDGRDIGIPREGEGGRGRGGRRGGRGGRRGGEDSGGPPQIEGTPSVVWMKASAATSAWAQVWEVMMTGGQWVVAQEYVEYI
jgi:hypothetical protein